jgi:uncharacterized membrane protein YphA (DoxX/SURF4 family)
MLIKNYLQHRWVSLALRLLLGFIFVYSGISKLGDLAGFAEAIDNYRILPRPAVNTFAIILPWVELLSGACLFSGVLLHGGALLITIMLAMFTAAVATSVAMGIDITCGCSTPFTTASRIGLGKLIENVALLAAALGVFFFGSPGWGFARHFDKNPMSAKNSNHSQPA